MVISWNDVIKVRSCTPRLRAMTKSGGQSQNGREQRVQSDAGYWEIVYEVIVNDPIAARAVRAMITLLRSGQEVLAKIFDRNQPMGAYGADVTASLTSAVAPRDVQIGITVTGAEVEPGAYFGIGVNRLHMVTEVVSGGPAEFYNHVLSDNVWDDALPWSDADPTAKNYTVKIMPPIRADFGSGTAVKFTGITMRGVLSDMSDGDMALDHGRFGSATFTIRESI